MDSNIEALNKTYQAYRAVKPGATREQFDYHVAFLHGCAVSQAKGRQFWMTTSGCLTVIARLEDKRYNYEILVTAYAEAKMP